MEAALKRGFFAIGYRLRSNQSFAVLETTAQSYDKSGPDSHSKCQCRLRIHLRNSRRSDACMLRFQSLRRIQPPEGHFVRLDAGFEHACALDTEGSIHCWGNNGLGQTDAPDGTFVEVACGDDFSCAPNANYEVTCWGSNTTTANTLFPALMATPLKSTFPFTRAGPQEIQGFMTMTLTASEATADCNDTDPSIYPGHPELCDGLDNCDGLVDNSDECDALPSQCGDGRRTGSEVCDDSFTDDCGTCNADCTALGWSTTCGDGNRCQEFEACDDGNADDGDACTNECQHPRCGDGIVYAGQEDVTTGNSIDSDGCLSS